MAAKIQTGFYVRGLPFRTNRQGDYMLEASHSGQTDREIIC